MHGPLLRAFEGCVDCSCHTLAGEKYAWMEAFTRGCRMPRCPVEMVAPTLALGMYGGCSDATLSSVLQAQPDRGSHVLDLVGGSDGAIGATADHQVVAYRMGSDHGSSDPSHGYNASTQYDRSDRYRHYAQERHGSRGSTRGPHQGADQSGGVLNIDKWLPNWWDRFLNGL